jgi:pyruvate/2-oxoglutarate dehydrogenase complex dihydrolipoamide dehydrogenase (E3) component
MEKDSLPMSMDYDVLIIGGGAAGKDAAFLAARAGLKTLLIEKEKLGGTSYHKGCYMIRALQMCAQSFRASEFSEKNPANMGIGSDNCGAADTGFGVLEYLRNWRRERAFAF